MVLITISWIVVHEYEVFLLAGLLALAGGEFMHVNNIAQEE